jgi:hypothetical protein
LRTASIVWLRLIGHRRNPGAPQQFKTRGEWQEHSAIASLRIYSELVFGLVECRRAVPVNRTQNLLRLYSAKSISSPRVKVVYFSRVPIPNFVNMMLYLRCQQLYAKVRNVDNK